MKSLKFIILSFFLISLFGCASSSYRAPYGAKIAKEENELRESEEKFIIIDKALHKKIRLVDVSDSETEDGRLIVKANIFNNIDETLEFQIQTLFKDKEGMSITDKTNWETILIPAKSYYYYKTNSLNNKTVKYTIRCKSVE